MDANRREWEMGEYLEGMVNQTPDDFRFGLKVNWHKNPNGIGLTMGMEGV